jgi:hypothetical protein
MKSTVGYRELRYRGAEPSNERDRTEGNGVMQRRLAADLNDRLRGVGVEA